MIFIFSAARSGSTWLGKIFDSHPDVLYLHEPEICDKGLDLLPYWFDREPEERHVSAAKTYLGRLTALRRARVNGTRPFFRKNYRAASAEWLRRALIYAAKSSERIRLGCLSGEVHIPDLCDRPTFTTVIKSVSALGRADTLIRAAGKDMRPVLLIRHPCGYVASMLRGREIGAMGKFGGLGRLLETQSAQNLGIAAAALEATDDVDRLAWNWLLANAEAYGAVRKVAGPVVIYDKFALEPTAGAIALFDQLGLSWTAETDKFIQRSRTRDGGYYSVFRQAANAMDSWQHYLDEAIVARVRAIACRHPVGAMFF